MYYIEIFIKIKSYEGDYLNLKIKFSFLVSHVSQVSVQWNDLRILMHGNNK